MKICKTGISLQFGIKSFSSPSYDDMHDLIVLKTSLDLWKSELFTWYSTMVSFSKVFHKLGANSIYL